MTEPTPVYEVETTQQIDISAIRTDGGTQTRAKLDDSTVFDYRILIRDSLNQRHWLPVAFS